MNAIELQLADESETDRLGQLIASVVRRGDVIGLVGNLGAGKTRLSRAIAVALGVDADSVTSPTFTLIHEYAGTIPLYHFDTYRLRTADEFDDLDAAEYWTRYDGICLIEWADRVWDRLPSRTWRIFLEIAAGNQRCVRIDIPSPEARERLVEALMACWPEQKVMHSINDKK